MFRPTVADTDKKMVYDSGMLSDVELDFGFQFFNFEIFIARL